MRVARVTGTTAGLLVLTSTSLIILLYACTGGAGGAPPPVHKEPSVKTVDLNPQESPKESAPPTSADRTPKPKVSEPKASEQKSLEPKSSEPKNPISAKPADPEPKPPEAGGKVVASPILTVKLALMADPRLLPYDIEVDVKGEEVVLSGEVATEEEKNAATLVAQQMAGVKTVANKLKVNKEAAQTLRSKQDERIAQQIKERFKKSKTLDAAGFDVKVQNGVVSLSGQTRYQVIILEAAEAVRQVPGVRAVHTDSVRLEAAG